MLELDRELFDEFKRVDAICRDMFLCQHGVSAYIDQMEQVPYYTRRRVPSWDKDHQMLKRSRWLRNQIAHEMTATDCTVSDVEYLREFHNRLLTQQDPLAVLAKAEREAQRAAQQKPVASKTGASYTYVPYNDSRPTRKWNGAFWGAVAVAVAAVVLLTLVVLRFLH